MDRHYHVPTRLLFNVVQEGAELIFTSFRLNIPWRFGFSYYYDMLSSRIQIRTIPVDRWRQAVGGWWSINKERKVAMFT